jgi:hypothetical protein
MQGKDGNTFNVTTVETLPIEFRPNKVKSIILYGNKIQRNMNGTLTFSGVVNRMHDDYTLDNFRI